MRLTGRLICANANELGLVQAYLPEHLRLTRAEPGCLSFSVTQSAEDPMVWLVDERFVDDAAFRAHRDRNQRSAWFLATKEIAREYQIAAE